MKQTQSHSSSLLVSLMACFTISPTGLVNLTPVYPWMLRGTLFFSLPRLHQVLRMENLEALDTE